ncbi:MAG: hypothetical protein AAF675_05230 [Pseudomonadota bacterium]
MRKIVEAATIRAKKAARKIGENKLIANDFDAGLKTLTDYLKTHRNKYQHSVGGQFIMRLHELGDAAGYDAVAAFCDRMRTHGWRFELSPMEHEALALARDMTSPQARIANLNYGANIVDNLLNQKQLMRGAFLGAVAGSAAILLSLGELFYFAKQYTREFAADWLDLSLVDPGTNQDEIVRLAQEITRDARGADGSLDAILVAERIAFLIQRVEAGTSKEEAAAAAQLDPTYALGIITGVLVLIIGKGLLKIIMEGFTGAVSKIDDFVDEIDEWANWKLGRSPLPTDNDWPDDDARVDLSTAPGVRERQGLIRRRRGRT